jgi:hypothetical protein
MPDRSEDGRLSYLDSEAHRGTVIQVSEIGEARGQFFEMDAERGAPRDGRVPAQSS